MIAIINDLHLDPKRVGGTTMQSREELKEYAFKELEKLLKAAAGVDMLIVLGDIFTSSHPNNWHVVKAATLFNRFLNSNPGSALTFVRGNHDSKSDRINDLCGLEVLHALVPRARLCWTPNTRSGSFNTKSGKVFYIIPHMFDQTEFDNAVGMIPSICDFLLIHANIDNGFAVNADHSLNLSAEQIKTLADKGVTVISAHEHQQRRPFENVHVIGNQFPVSIADCIGNDYKHMMFIEDGEISYKTTWTAEGSYADTGIDELESYLDHQFIRVSGECQPNEFSDALTKIAKARKDTDAFVLANSLKVIRQDQKKVEADVDKLNVIEMLVECVNEEFQDLLKGLVRAEA